MLVLEIALGLLVVPVVHVALAAAAGDMAEAVVGRRAGRARVAGLRFGLGAVLVARARAAPAMGVRVLLGHVSLPGRAAGRGTGSRRPCQRSAVLLMALV